MTRCMVTFAILLLGLLLASSATAEKSKAAARETPSLCDGALGQRTLIYTEDPARDGKEKAFYHFHAPYEYDDPGPWEVFDNFAFVIDRPFGRAPRIHRLDLSTGEHEVFSIIPDTLIRVFLAVDKDLVGGFLTKRLQGVDIGQWDGLEYAFTYRFST
jgi:hypothetical protein